MIILGAGGFAREVYCWAVDAGAVVEGFYQDSPETPRIGLPARLYTNVGDLSGKRFVVAVGDPAARINMWSRALGWGMIPANPIIHPTATLGHHVTIDVGSIVCPQAVITTDVVIGRSVIINLGATVGHDTIIEQFSTVSPGANISGRCVLGMMSYVGTNSCMREKSRLGMLATLGMGAVLLSEVPDGETWVGSPARRMTRV